MHKTDLLIIWLITVVFLISCQKEVVRDMNSQVIDGHYDSEFPQKPVTPHLKDILESVHLVSILAFYQAFHFDKAAKVTPDMITNEFIRQHKPDRTVFEQPASGTATLLYHHNNRIAFLTCAHIVDLPDTVYTHFEEENQTESPYIQSYVYKIRQSNNIINKPIAYGFKILAIDRENDLAIIGKEVDAEIQYRMTTDADYRVKVLDIPRGEAGELDWGSFTYLLGFPRAKKMVSAAIVSNPNYDSEHSFILDASLQKGISGGLIIAIRDGVPHFELVGMAKGIAGRVEQILVPDRAMKVYDWQVEVPYDGDIFLRKQEIVEPGMIYAISIETILEFIKENEAGLKSQGYNTELFFKPTSH